MSPGHVVVGEEGRILVADVIVDVVKVLGVLAGHGLFGEGAGQRQLVEDCLVAAEEAPVVQLFGSVGELHLVADVEDFALVVGVGVVAVLEALAAEGGLVAANDELGVRRKFVRRPLGSVI